MQSKDLFLLLNTLKKNANIGVVYSGDPLNAKNVIYRSHNTRSWKSYQAVAQDIANALTSLNFKNVYLFEEGIGLLDALMKKKIHFVWLNTGGVQGADSAGHCAGIMQAAGIPYVGHSPLQAALMDDKIAFKYFLKGAGIRTAPFTTWHPRDNIALSGNDGFHQRLAEIKSMDSNKLVVKPACGRASRHIYIAHSIEETMGLCRKVYSQTGNRVMVEQFLPGKEYCIAIMGKPIKPDSSDDKSWLHRHQQPQCFGLFERILDDPQGIVTSMDVRPISAKVVRPLDSKKDSKVIQELNHIGIAIYSKLGLYGLVRMDARMDVTGQIHVLEVNPKPDLKAPDGKVTSLVALGLEQLGLSYQELIEQIVLHTLDYQSCYSISAEQLDWLVQNKAEVVS